MIAAIDQADLDEQTDTAALTTSISVTFGDVDLTDVGHTATVKAAVASGVTTGLALDEAALIALVTPGTVTKTSGADNGAVTLGFSAASTAFDYLSTDEVLTLTYTLEIDDLDPDGKSEQTFVVTITGTNDAPFVTAGTTLAYGWNDGAKVIDASVTVADIDNAQLVGATVSIGTGYVEGEDFLGFVDGGGITGLFNAATGVLELSGTATKAAYEAALRSVTYLNIAEDPSPDDRTISFSVDDGEDESLAATSTVSITPFVDVFGDEFANSNLEGTAAANRIYGFAENDNLFGLGGNDQLFGDLGNDDLFGGEGDDLLDGGEGDDYLAGGAGTDRYVGGDGAEQYDTISFENETGTLGVVVNLAAGTATDTYGNNETLSGIEDIAGSNNDDTLIGDDGDNFFRGFDGSDSYDGGGGTFDQVSYDGETGGSGAFVDLGSVDGNGFASGTDTYGNAESFKNIEVLRGSQYGDHFIGDAGNNTFRGMAGNDTLNGGDGFDAVRYDRDASRGGTNGVTVNLALGTATDGFGDTDTLISIENVRGSQYGDLLIGNGSSNDLRGLGGDDTLVGGGGDDVLDGGTGEDYLEGGAGADTYIGGDGVEEYDTISFENETGLLGVQVNLALGIAADTYGNNETVTGIEDVTGSVNDDVLIGNEIGNYFRGLEGADSYDGGDGNFDQVSFSSETGGTGAVVNLDSGVGTDTYGNPETFTSIEVLRGSQYADSFTGDELNNTFRGLAGADYFNGAGGVDAIRYDRDANAGGTNGVTVDLAAGTATDGFGDVDTFIDIEDAYGTQFDDTLVGSDLDNELRGLGGSDILVGGDGNDTLLGGEGADEFVISSSVTAGLDEITDFELDVDSVSLHGFGASAVIALEANGSGSDLVVNSVHVATLDFVDSNSDVSFIYNSVDDHYMVSLMSVSA